MLVAAGSVLVALGWITSAHAGGRAAFPDPEDLPVAPRPPTLPELTHAEPEATVETTAGALLPASGAAVAPAHAYVERFGVEVPLDRRRWYVGAEYEAAAGDQGRGTFELVGGNVAIEGRALWATTTGLAFGGGLSLVLPVTAFSAHGAAARVALDAVTLRPWDVSMFTPSSFGARPFVDVRAVDGPFVVQFRQELDVTQSTATASDRRVYAVAGVYVGCHFAPLVAGGLEAFEAYAVDAPGVSDSARATVIAAPNVRFMLPWVQPAVSVFTGLGKPFGSSIDGIWGFRVAVTLVREGRR